MDRDEAFKKIDDIARKGDPDELKAILEAYPDLNSARCGIINCGIMPIHYAAMAGNTRNIKVILEMGVDINLKDAFGGWAPLHYAARFRKLRMVKYLCRHGADVNARSSALYTPLLIIASHEMSSPLKLMEYLLEQGADPSARSKYNEDVIDCMMKIVPGATSEDILGAYHLLQKYGYTSQTF